MVELAFANAVLITTALPCRLTPLRVRLRLWLEGLEGAIEDDDSIPPTTGGTTPAATRERDAEGPATADVDP